MGVDFLDCMFRIEKAFQIPRPGIDLHKLLDVARDAQGGYPVITCDDILNWLELTLTDYVKPIPDDCWPRLQACIAATMRMPVEKVTLESRIVQDLGFT